MKKFFSSIKNKNITSNFLNKAYVEGVYNDSPLNRKLGRVGMSYKEYNDKVQHSKQKEKKINEIPENIQDLSFNKNIASYNIEDNKIQIELISHEKYGEKLFNLRVNNKEIGNYNTTQLTRKMKELKQKNGDLEKDNSLRNFPLTPEELNAKWGDTGFTYTYYKDNLDIKVWIREDSTKENPKLNIYVKDIDTKKQKSYTNLSLIQVHNKLLEFDLNPSLDKSLTNEQKQEYNNLKVEDNKKDDNYESTLLKENKILNYKKEIKSGEYLINGNNVNIIVTSKDNISLTITRENSFKKKYLRIKNNKTDLSYVLDEINEKGDKYDLSNEDTIKPNKDINIDFNNIGAAYFKTKNNVFAYYINPKDTSKIDIIVYDNDGNILGVDSTNTDNFENFKNNFDLNTDKSNQISHLSMGMKNKNNQKPPKDIIESYSNADTLTRIPNVMYMHNDEVNINNFNKDFTNKHFKDTGYSRGIQKNNLYKKEVYAFIKSKAFINWLNDMPNSNKGISKKEIYNNLIKEADRISPFGDTYLTEDKHLYGGVVGAKYEIIKKYF